MRAVNTILKALMLSFVLLILSGRAVYSGLSHDENKFVYAGEALADHNQLPYRDYPYDQMPYAAIFYAASATVSPADFLAARLLGALVWLGCFIVLLALAELLAPADGDAQGRASNLALLATQVVLVLVFLFDPLSTYVFGSAKNNSFATLFSLLGFLYFVRGLKGRTAAPQAAFWSGLFVAVAGCTRLNYFSLLFVLAAGWLLFALSRERRAWLKLLSQFAGGAVVGALPALLLAAAAPAQFYYANVVQLRLTTLYYQGILSRDNMDLAGKLITFQQSLTGGPVNIALDLALLAGGVAFLLGFIRRRSSLDLIGLVAAGCGIALLATAFMATPMMSHYLFAPLPFLLIVGVVAAGRLWRANRAASAAMLLVVLALLLARSSVRGSLGMIRRLGQPDTWPPLQMHSTALALHADWRIPTTGMVLSLLPMAPAEAGFEGYGFTASGSNSWRTSPLLTADRRKLYGVTSPEELGALLDANPPAAILTGFETANPGFTFQDLGGLERPFTEYARQHGYAPVTLPAQFYGHPLKLWLSPQNSAGPEGR